MVTQNLLNQYRREVESASNDARNYLTAMCEAYIEVNPNASVADMRKFAIETLQDGLYMYGDEAKVIANDFFDRLAQDANSKATAEMFDNTDADIVEQKVRYYAKSLVEGDTSKFIKDVSDLTGFYVKREAFCNMAKNCGKAGIRYARVPSGRETCAFCFMLASRGFVYWGEKEAGADGHEYHPHCDCIIVPGFHKDTGINEDTQIQGYKPSEIRERYQKCYDAINPNGTWAEVYEQWKNSGSEDKWEKFKTKALIKEINTRDWGWLWTGKTLKVDYETLEFEEKVRKHEKTTAEILSTHGIKCVFRKDVKENYDGKGNNKGLADLKNGIELKTLQNLVKDSTIDDGIRSTNSKLGVKSVVFDNTQQLITDEECIKKILEARPCKVPVYMMNGNKYLRVK